MHAEYSYQRKRDENCVFGSFYLIGIKIRMKLIRKFKDRIEKERERVCVRVHKHNYFSNFRKTSTRFDLIKR